MQHQRTQIYLGPSQHAALTEEAHRRGLSLAGLIRRLVDEHFARARENPGGGERKAAALSLIGLGRSGLRDVSEATDRHLASALEQGLVKERAGRYERTARRRKR